MKKKLRERDVTKYEKKFGSPYWYWISKNSRSESEYTKEPLEANPDKLSEDDSLWSVSEKYKTDISKKQKLKSALNNALRSLTKTDKEIVILMSQKFHTERELAEKLGVSRGFIQHRIRKIRSLSIQNLKNGL
jgi:DNA-directed RNA polymerase specialized sigma subunit